MNAESWCPAQLLTMEIGTPACSISVRVVYLESCRVIRRSPLEQPPELVGVPLGVDRDAQFVSDDVLAALVPAEFREPGLIRGARRRGSPVRPCAECWVEFPQCGAVRACAFWSTVGINL